MKALLLVLALLPSPASANAISALTGDAHSLFANFFYGMRCWMAETQQIHYAVSATTGTTTFILASPKTAGHTIHIRAWHTYTAGATVSPAALVWAYGRSSATGVTISTSVAAIPAAAPSSEAFGHLDDDGEDMWTPVGWKLPKGESAVCNLSSNLTAGTWLFHVTWFELEE